ncbi:MAG: hypothetical protein II891_06925 [Bacteroidales bacterium]|nr:hypothetical protein [Bacteroidales bacterium]
MAANTKNFREIYQGLPVEMQGSIKAELIYQLRINQSTFWRWTKGHYPTLFLTRKAATQIINELLGTQHTPETLFPMN